MEPIRLGSIGPEVEDVQRRLEALGLTCPSDPSVFDPATEAAVRTFQQQRGLIADGVVGSETWQTLVGASYSLGDRLLYVTRPLMRGDDVRELQRRLNRLGFDAGYDDGLFGPQTVAAVREFQLNAGFLVDGIAGRETVEHLLRLHRSHQEAPVAAVREREALRRPSRRSLAGARLMVDPGHGIADPGLSSADGAQEHELTWRIGTALEGRLAALGAHVVLSRGPNTSPTPSQRAAQANAEDVELILSIHLNGANSPRARGAAAYHFGTEVQISDRGQRLAELALAAVLAATGTQDCRVHPSISPILRESRAPAAVIEPGFLTHPEEGRQLAEPRTQQRLAAALTHAITHYLLGDPPSTPARMAPVTSARSTP
ncbi:MAG: N-acetylmuramoyl-L-alanine amidase [Nitriliruptor sp.]|nr:MAG: N-acetylmuramoyl-L-alanine amidase [Nitriliruptor sp.]